MVGGELLSKGLIKQCLTAEHTAHLFTQLLVVHFISFYISLHYFVYSTLTLEESSDIGKKMNLTTRSAGDTEARRREETKSQCLRVSNDQREWVVKKKPSTT